MNRFGKGLFLTALLLALGGLTAAQGQEGSRGFINAREFAESQGIAYQWFPMQKMLVLTKGTRLMRLVVDQTQAVVDNQPFTLPSAPRLEDGQVMVPARSIIQVFGVASTQPPPPGPIAPPPPPPGPPPATIIDPGPPPAAPPAGPEAGPEAGTGAILVTARHSIREDHTRVVLEFDGNVSFTTETPGPGKFKLRINGCRNLIPTKRSNPVGRDLKGVSYNSGPNRQGLVVNFDLHEGGKPPTIETVGNPFRMILSFYGPAGATPASATPAIATGTTPVAAVASAAPAMPKTAIASSVPSLVTAPSQLTALSPQAPKPLPEISIDVPLATLSRSIFQGRAIIIEPAHGGNDKGATVPGLPSEKEITLAIGLELQRTLRKMGFSAFLLRSGDTDIPADRRQAAINKAGGDLFVSLHVGASADEGQEGAACFWYDPKGINLEVDTGGKLSPQLVFTEWAQTTRFDLARFLGQKIRDRLVSHLGAKDRGALGLPLLPLQFLIYPGVTIEVGMLSHPQEGPRLATKGYQEAAAKAIANGIVDFFNGIRLNP